MRIHILDPDTWIPLWEEALRPQRKSGVRGLTRGIVQFLHTRHVGIPPRLAAGLAEFLFWGWRPVGRTGYPAEFRLWSTLFGALTRFGGERRRPASPLSAGRRGLRLEFTPRSCPFYTVLRIALPLIARACESKAVGECYLFGQEGYNVPPHFRKQYWKHEEKLYKELERQTRTLASLFRHDRGLTAHGLSRRPWQAAPPPDGGIPDTDAATLAFILGLDPELPEPPRRRDWELPRRHATLNRSGFRPKEEGITGVTMTRRIDDFDDMVQSELLNLRPNLRPMFFDRLINTGYLAHHRPPPQQKKRDVLFAGVMLEPARSESCMIAKACWFQCVVYLGTLLVKAGLVRSDFVWLESDRLGGLRAMKTSLELLPLKASEIPAELPKEYRVRFLAGLRWMPAFLDFRTSYLAELAPPAGAWEREQLPATWIARALSRSLATPRTSGISDGGQPEAHPGTAADYSVVGLNLFLPGTHGSLAESEWRARVASLRESLALSPQTAHSFNLIWPPRGRIDRWEAMIAGYGHGCVLRQIEVPSSDGAGKALDRVATTLVRFWMEQLEEEVFGEV